MFKYKISIENGFILAVTEGSIEKENIFDLGKDVFLAAKENNLTCILVDHRALQKNELSLDDCIEVADYFEHFGNHVAMTKTAIVSNTENYGIGSLTESTFLDKNIRFQNFTSIRKAKEWLGV